MEHPPVEIENVFKPGHGHGGEGGLASALPLLLAGRADHGYGYGLGGLGGFGAGALGFIAGALIGNRRGGFFGGDGDGGCGAETRLQSNADTLAILTAVGNAKDATTSGFATTALALSQGIANIKDSQQASTFLLSNQLNTVNQNVSEQGCATREAVLAAQNAIISKIDCNTIAALTAEVAALKNHGHSRDAEISITQSVNQQQVQAQAQLQTQSQFDRLFGLVHGILAEQQVARATNANLIVGSTGVATGAQTANPTNVRA